MPTKMNRAGNQQPYVPQGNGDASGEYADNERGSNVHYAPKETPKSDSSTKSIDKPIEEPSEKKTGNENIDVNTLVREGGEIKISRNSLDEAQHKILTQALNGFYKDLPNMQRFDKIRIDKRPSSLTGGYIKTYWDYSKGLSSAKKGYELYLNSGWVDEDKSKVPEETRQKLISQLTAELDAVQKLAPNDTNRINKLKESISYYENKPITYSNVAFKLKDKNARFENIINHELMHRELAYKLGSALSRYTSFNATPEQERLHDEILKTYMIAKKNGDAKKISEYADSDINEFVSEAYSQIKSGIETPAYIKDMINKIKEFKV